MNTSKRTLSTPLALAFGAALIAAAYFVPHLLAAPRAEAGTTDDLLKAIATKDSNGDGLPDWEKVLYGIPVDASTTDYFHLGMTDAQAVAKGLIVPKAATPAVAATTTASSTDASSTPADAFVPGGAPASGSLTEQFTQNFFAQYLAANTSGTPLSDSDLTTFVTSAIQQLEESQSQQDAFTLSEVKVSGSGQAAMRAYAIAAEQVFNANTAQVSKGELLYLSDAINNNDPTALDNISKIATAYTKGAVALMQLAVPTELAADHLALANALAQMGNVTSELAALNRDPLLTSVGLAGYTTNATAMRNAFVNMAAALTNAGIVLKPGDPGYSLESITPANGY